MNIADPLLGRSKRIRIGKMRGQIRQSSGQYFHLCAADVQFLLEFWSDGTIADFFRRAPYLIAQIFSVPALISTGSTILLNVLKEQFCFSGEGRC